MVLDDVYLDLKGELRCFRDLHGLGDMTTMGSITTEVPADVTEVDVTSDSLQNLRDYGSQLQCSWILLAAVLLATKMLAL